MRSSRVRARGPGIAAGHGDALFEADSESTRAAQERLQRLAFGSNRKDGVDLLSLNAGGDQRRQRAMVQCFKAGARPREIHPA